MKLAMPRPQTSNVAIASKTAVTRVGNALPIPMCRFLGNALLKGEDQTIIKHVNSQSKENRHTRYFSYLYMGCYRSVGRQRAPIPMHGMWHTESHRCPLRITQGSKSLTRLRN
jgi:hypothetical protein